MTTLILSEIMIEAIIFDFGDVFIDLKKEAIDTEFRKLGLTAWHDDLDVLNKRYEIGKIDEFEFMQGFQNDEGWRKTLVKENKKSYDMLNDIYATLAKKYKIRIDPKDTLETVRITIATAKKEQKE